MKLISRYTRPYRKTAVSCMTLKIIATISELFIPWTLSYILDTAAREKDIGSVLMYGVVMIMLAIVIFLTNFKANRLSSLVARNTVEDIRHDMYSRISHLSIRQMDSYTIPSLESRLTSDTYNITHFINFTLRIAIKAPLLLIGGLAMTIAFAPTLSLVLVALLPLLAIIMYAMRKIGVPLWKKSQEKSDVMVRKVRENATGIRVIKALGMTDYEEDSFDDIIDDLSRNERRANITMSSGSPFISLVFNLGLVGIVAVGAVLANKGKTTTGTIIAFLSYLYIILNAMMTMTRIVIMFTRADASAKRIEEVLETPRDMETSEDDQKEEAPYITFEDVSFSYLGVKDNVKDISFTLQKGGTLGIIGSTGSGKSTIINLLLRLYDRREGRILIDGRDIASIDEDELRRHYGVAFQNDAFLNDTVRENIDFGRNLPDEAIEKAMETAQASTFIMNLPGKLDYMVSQRGMNLSGGQKQRLLLSRALAGNPDILILDDSSSALDYRTDALFREALERNYSETTKIIVAQRVSSIKHADLILLLEDGRITAKGRHEELLASSPLYREIADSQMGGDFDAE